MNEPHVIRRARCHTFALLSLIVALAITGCATTIARPPFQEFADSVQKLRSGADNSLGALYDQTGIRYADDTAEGGAALESALLTAPPGDPLGWVSSSPPLFLRVAQFRDGVYRLNSSLVNYAAALLQLASPDLLDPETFNKLATDLNANLGKALPALGVTPPAQGVAIFSTAATAAFRVYLQNKQRSALVDALTKNQGAIQNTAGLGSDAILLTVRAVRNEYNQRSTALARDITRPDAPVTDRRSKARSLRLRPA